MVDQNPKGKVFLYFWNIIYSAWSLNVTLAANKIATDFREISSVFSNQFSKLSQQSES